MVGSYELIQFQSRSGRLGRRARPVHLRRYLLDDAEDQYGNGKQCATLGGIDKRVHCAAREWFRAQGYTPFAFQEAVWQAYAERR